MLTKGMGSLTEADWEGAAGLSRRFASLRRRGDQRQECRVAQPCSDQGETLTTSEAESSARLHLWRDRRGRNDIAVVAGVAGAGLSASVVIILGVANLIADGFSMAVSNYAATRAELQKRALARAEEEQEIRDIPEGEREEIRQIFSLKGFSGDQLDRVVEVITANPRVWVDTMMVEERGYSVTREEPLRAASSTLVAFVVIGFIPLLRSSSTQRFHRSSIIRSYGVP